VKSSGVPAFVVFNAAPHSATTLLEDARAIAEGAGLNAAPVILRERSAYRASWPLGKGVTEIEPGSKAALELLELKDWVLAQLQVCTPSPSEEIKEVSNG
jgi:chromosome partitioning protein